MASLRTLAEQWGWYLLNCSQSEWLHHCSDVCAGWQGFQAYRDRITQQHRPKE